MKLWTRSCVAGIKRVSRAQLRDLQDYLGAELGFYFSWASFYTRYLWAPALLGLVTYIAQTQLELRISDALLASNASDVEIGSGISRSDGIIGHLSSNATASDEPSPERVAKEALTALYALFMSVWAALFVERWKRRAKLLCLDWDVIGQGASTTTRLPLHPQFKEDAVKPGFYTAEGDWIDLDKSKLKVRPSTPSPTPHPNPSPSPSSSPNPAPNPAPNPNPSPNPTPNQEEEAKLCGEEGGALQLVRSGWHDPQKHLRRYLSSIVIMVTMTLACIGAIVGVLIVRLSLTEWNSTYGRSASSKYV